MTIQDLLLHIGLMIATTQPPTTPPDSLLSHPELRLYMLLGALVGGLGATLVSPAANVKQALLKWGGGITVSLIFTPILVHYFDLLDSPDAVFSAAAILSLMSWLIIRTLRSITTKQFVAFVARLLNLRSGS